MNVQFWLKLTTTLIVLGLITWLAPALPLDRWNLFSPKKVATMILALASIQAFGSAMALYLGLRTGALLTGFFGGLISSTATTASLARRSKVSDVTENSGEVLTFLAATGAMLFEGLVIVMTGTSEIHFSNVLIFVGPILAISAMIFVQYKKTESQAGSSENVTFLILPILKLSVFIIVILSISKVFQNLFGQKGLLLLTFLVSLFEIHGSVIANIQLRELETISTHLLSSLLSVSVVSSCLSKLFLIWTLGSTILRTQVIKRTALLFVSLAVSWGLSMSLT